MSLLYPYTLLDASQLILVIATTVAVGVFMINYLNKSNQSKRKNEDYIKSIELGEDLIFLNKKIKEIEGKVDLINVANIEFSEIDKLNIIKEIEKKIETESTENYIQKLLNKIETKTTDDILKDNIQSSLDRLNAEKNGLFVRGNFNLVIGVLISGVGGYLAYFFIYKLPVVGTTVELLSYSLPRLSLFMLIALLVFFFLNLYKKSLDDIKYFQNEITNMEAKYLALQLARSIKNHKLLSTILENIAQTERNFILEKDQTTIELEKERISANNTNSTMEMFKDLLKR